MGWKQFFASIVDSFATLGSAIAWPAAILTLILVFRRPIADLLGRLRRLKVAGGEADFGDGLANVEIAVDKFLDSEPEDVANEADSEESRKTDDNRTRPDGPVEDPSSTVLRAWEDLAAAIFDLRRATAGRGRPSRDVGVVLRQMVQGGVVNDLFVESVLGLQSLRNSVAHAEEVPNVGSAYIYAERSRELRRAANAISKMQEASEGSVKEALDNDRNGLT